MTTGKRKLCTRLNLLFDDESEAKFFERVAAAILDLRLHRLLERRRAVRRLAATRRCALRHRVHLALEQLHAHTCGGRRWGVGAADGGGGSGAVEATEVADVSRTIRRPPSPGVDNLPLLGRCSRLYSAGTHRCRMLR